MLEQLAEILERRLGWLPDFIVDNTGSLIIGGILLIIIIINL